MPNPLVNWSKTLSMVNGISKMRNIHEVTEEGSRSISGVLSYCKERIVYPYLRLLGIMGLKPFLMQSTTDTCKFAPVINRIYIVFVTMMLIVGYFLQYFTCFRRDRGFAFKNDTEESTVPRDPSVSWNRICNGNSVYIHILPNILHLSSFLYMVFLYRLHDDEQLPNLIERVFLQAAQTRANFFTQRKPVRTFQFLVILSITWIVLSCACQLVQVTTHKTMINYLPHLTLDAKHCLVVLMTISNSWQDVIQVTVIVSYCIHCYLLSTYLNLIHARVQQHSITLPDAIKEIGELSNLLKYLNNDLAPGLGPLLVLDSSLAISGLLFLFNGGNPLQMRMYIWDYISVGLTSLLWFSLFILPVSQIAKLTSSCKRIQEIGHLVRLRPFGYQDTLQDDLDSFLLFVTSLQMEVNIFRIPISTPILSFIVMIFIFGLSTWGLVSD